VPQARDGERRDEPSRDDADVAGARRLEQQHATGRQRGRRQQTEDAEQAAEEQFQEAADQAGLVQVQAQRGQRREDQQRDAPPVTPQIAL
jgi:hypothetical protein